MNDPDRASAVPETIKWREVFSEAIRFWERMRLVYCGVLALVVAAQFLLAWPASASKVELDLFLTLFLLAVLANALYTLAYVPDVFVQLSEFRPAWRRGRWVLFLVGTAFAVIVTRFVTMGMFGGHGP